MVTTNARIPALSLWQPWAHAVVHLGKRIENRDWTKAEKKIEGDDFWPFLVELLLPQVEFEALNEISRRRGLVAEKPKKASAYSHSRTALQKALVGMTPVQAKGLAIELVTSSGGYRFGPYGSDAMGQGISRAAAFYKVDATKVGAAAIAEAKKLQEAKSKTSPAPKAKAATKTSTPAAKKPAAKTKAKPAKKAKR